MNNLKEAMNKPLLVIDCNTGRVIPNEAMEKECRKLFPELCKDLDDYYAGMEKCVDKGYLRGMV